MTERVSDQVNWEARYRELKELHIRQAAAWVHDARGYITAIMGTIDLIKYRGLTPKQLEDADSISQAAVEMNIFFEQLLIRARLEAGEVQINQRPFAVQELLQSVYNTHKVKARRSELMFEYDIHRECPALLIGDIFQIRRVLNNLVSNAIKYTKEGGVYLMARYDPKEQLLHFVIRDTGIGVDQDDQTRIFRIFQQSDHTLLSNPSEGFGLGLYICCELTALMNGTIELESVPGKGSTFTVTIPLLPKT